MPPSILFFEEPRFGGRAVRYQLNPDSDVLVDVADQQKGGVVGSARIEGLKGDLSDVYIQAFSRPGFRGQAWLITDLGTGRIPDLKGLQTIGSFRVLRGKPGALGMSPGSFANDPPEIPVATGPLAWELTLYQGGTRAFTAKTPGESAGADSPHAGMSVVQKGAWEHFAAGQRPQDFGLPKRLLAWQEETGQIRPAAEEYQSLLQAAQNPDDPDLQEFAFTALRTLGITPRRPPPRRDRGGPHFDFNLVFGGQQLQEPPPPGPAPRDYTQAPPAYGGGYGGEGGGGGGYVPPPAPAGRWGGGGAGTSHIRAGLGTGPNGEDVVWQDHQLVVGRKVYQLTQAQVNELETTGYVTITL